MWRVRARSVLAARGSPMSSAPRAPWRDKSTGRKAVSVVSTLVQLSLALGAWVDLARRPRSLVRGRKSLWASIIGVNFVGPLAYLRWGRVTRTTSDAPGSRRRRAGVRRAGRR